MVSHLEVNIPNKPPTPKNIGEGLKGPQRKFYKEALFVKYDKNKNVSLISDPIPIKSLPEGTKVLHSLIDTSIKKGDCYDACIFVSHHYANRSYHIQVIGFYKSYSPVEHADSLIINISIADMHRITTIIFDVSNAFQNKNFPIHERFYVIPPTCYLDWFEISYSNAPLDRYESPFLIQCKNGIQGTKPSGRQWNLLLDAMVTIL